MMPKLFREIDGKDKYLVLNRRGKKPDFETFVLGQGDPCAAAALEAYVSKAIELGLDGEYAESVDNMRLRWQEFIATRGVGQPDAGPDANQLARPDHPDIMDALGEPGGTTFKVTRVA